MVHHLLVEILHEFRVFVRVLFLSCHVIQARGSVDRFSQRPVHAVMDHRLSVPVSRVHDAGSAVRVPAVGNRAVKEILRGAYIFCRLLLVIPIGGERPLSDQSGPLDAVAGRRAVRLELVVGLILIAFKIRNPVAAVVLGDPPVVAGCPSQDRGSSSCCRMPIPGRGL